MEEEFGTVNTAKNGMFQERELIFANDQFSSIRWSLDKYGDTAQVTLQRGEAYVCEVLVHAFPGESPVNKSSITSMLNYFFINSLIGLDACGLAEQPANGYIDYEGTSRAVCRCHFGYKPSPAGVRDCLLWGQWEGEQCTCKWLKTKSGRQSLMNSFKRSHSIKHKPGSSYFHLNIWGFRAHFVVHFWLLGLQKYSFNWHRLNKVREINFWIQ